MGVSFVLAFAFVCVLGTFNFYEWRYGSGNWLNVLGALCCFAVAYWILSVLL